MYTIHGRFLPISHPGFPDKFSWWISIQNHPNMWKMEKNGGFSQFSHAFALPKALVYKCCGMEELLKTLRRGEKRSARPWGQGRVDGDGSRQMVQWLDALMGFYSDLMGLYGDSMGYYGIYPLVMTNIANWNIPTINGGLLLWKISSISIRAIYTMAMLVITRGLLHVKAKPPNLDHLRSLVLQVINYIYFDPYPDDGNSCDYPLVLFLVRFWTWPEKKLIYLLIW